jgi:hypothetical protein
MKDRRSVERGDSAGIAQTLRGLVGLSGRFSKGDVTVERGPDSSSSFTVTKQIPDHQNEKRFIWKLSVQDRFPSSIDDSLKAPVPVVTLKTFTYDAPPMPDGSLSPHVPRDPIHELEKVLGQLQLPKRG